MHKPETKDALVSISLRFSIFERLCLELLRTHWAKPGLELFGKRGERQFGIDILDLSGDAQLFAAQCKLKEEHKSLQSGEIHREIEQVKSFSLKVTKYAILTTAKTSTASQLAIREINQAHLTTGLFEVELLTWDQLCPLLHRHQDVQERFYGGIGI